MSIGKNIRWGVAVNKLRKLERQWHFWNGQRQKEFLRGRNWQQEMAEKECLRLGPAIVALRHEIQAIEEDERKEAELEAAGYWDPTPAPPRE